MAASKTLTFRIAAEGGDALKEFGSLAKGAKRDMKKVAEALDDGRTAGKKLADSLMADAAAIESELRGIESASSRMAQALGDDFDGRPVENLVLDLRKAGLTFDEIEADAESLALAVKRLDDVQLSRVRSEVGQIDDGMRRVGETTDNSRSVMANFAGNAVSELPGIASAMGPVNVAMGQFAEYAVDGNIKLSGLAATFGPMAAGLVVLKGVSDHFGQIAERKAFNAAEVESWTQALLAGETALEHIVTLVNSAEGLESSIGVDLIPILEEMGIGAREYAEMLEWSDGKLRDFVASHYGLPIPMSRSKLVLETLRDALANYRSGLDETADRQWFLGDAVEGVAPKLDRFGGALGDSADGAAAAARAGIEAADAAAELDLANRRAATAAGWLADKEYEAERALREYNAAWDALTGEIDAEQSLMDLQDAFAEVADTAMREGQSVEDAMREQRREILDAKDKVIQYGREILGLPPEALTDILALIDEGSVAEAERRLNDLARARRVKMLVDSDVGLMDPVGKASGGPVSSSTLYEVAEGGVPELLDVGDRTYLMMGAQSGFVRPPSAGAPSTGSAGGSGPVVIQLVVDGRVLTEVVHDGLLTKQRRVPLGIRAS